MLLPFCSGSGSSFFSCIFLPFFFLLSTVEHSATTTPLPLLSTSYNQQNHYYRWLTLDAAQKFVDELSMNEANKEAAPTRGKDRRNSTPIITGGVYVYTCRERERREEWEDKQITRARRHTTNHNSPRLIPNSTNSNPNHNPLNSINHN